MGIVSPLQKDLFVFYTSVSSVFSSSAVLVGGVIGDRTQNGELGFAEWARCSPAFSRSSSFQESMEARRDNISYRLVSARGVDKKEMRTLDTSRRSTFVSEELRRRRRRASMRCSFRITASGLVRRKVGWVGGQTFVS